MRTHPALKKLTRAEKYFLLQYKEPPYRTPKQWKRISARLRAEEIHRPCGLIVGVPPELLCESAKKSPRPSPFQLGNPPSKGPGVSRSAPFGKQKTSAGKQVPAVPRSSCAKSATGNPRKRRPQPGSSSCPLCHPEKYIPPSVRRTGERSPRTRLRKHSMDSEQPSLNPTKPQHGGKRQ